MRRIKVLSGGWDNQRLISGEGVQRKEKEGHVLEEII